MTAPFDLARFLADETEQVDAALERALATDAFETLPSAVGAAVAHGVRSGGKRLRPILCAEGWRAVRRADERAGATTDRTARTEATPSAVYDLGAALEMIHAYSLMHDDLPCMDNADLRRGQPTTWRVHGEEATIRGGVALIPLAAARALEAARGLGVPDNAARRAVGVLLKAAGSAGMVGGQALDLLGEGRALDADSLDELHAHKTGALLTAALVVGGVAAGADPAREAALEAYGRRIGLAFQIADDILDATASSETLGKEPSDATLGKSTYVALHGLDEARRRGFALVGSALAELAAADLESPALTALAHYVMERER